MTSPVAEAPVNNITAINTALQKIVDAGRALQAFEPILKEEKRGQVSREIGEFEAEVRRLAEKHAFPGLLIQQAVEFVETQYRSKGRVRVRPGETAAAQAEYMAQLRSIREQSNADLAATLIAQARVRGGLSAKAADPQ